MPNARVTPFRAAPRPGGARPRLDGLDSSPLHGELLGVERLEERARALAAGFTRLLHASSKHEHVILDGSLSEYLAGAPKHMTGVTILRPFEVVRAR